MLMVVPQEKLAKFYVSYHTQDRRYPAPPHTPTGHRQSPPLLVKGIVSRQTLSLLFGSPSWSLLHDRCSLHQERGWAEGSPSRSVTPPHPTCIGARAWGPLPSFNLLLPLSPGSRRKSLQDRHSLLSRSSRPYSQICPLSDGGLKTKADCSQEQWGHTRPQLLKRVRLTVSPRTPSWFQRGTTEVTVEWPQARQPACIYQRGHPLPGVHYATRQAACRNLAPS